MRRRQALAAELPSWLLRAGLAFVFSYAAVSSFLRPTTFAKYFPSFVPHAWALDLLPAFAAFELLLAVGFMTDRYSYVASLLAAATLVTIIVANPNAFEVLFRNVAIACTALALALQSRQERQARESGGLAAFSAHPEVSQLQLIGIADGEPFEPGEELGEASARG